MIIFGTRGLQLNKGKPGEFHCPGCNGRTYQHKKLQRFFTLYFIPVIPLDVVQDWVECQTCKQAYKPSVLDHNPTAEREAREAQFRDNLKGVLIHFARMSERRDPTLFGEVNEVYKSLTEAELPTSTISSEIAQPAFNILPAAERVAPFLNDRGREAVVAGLIKLAAPMDDTKKAALAEVAKTLTMTDVHFAGVLASVSGPA